MRRLLTRSLCIVLTLTFLSHTLLADQPPKTDAKQQDQKKLVTVTYDVKEIVTKMATWNPGGPAAALERLSTTLVEEIDPVLAAKFLGKNAVYSIQLLDEKQLEIRADKKTQEVLADCLAAIRHLLDVAVEVKCRLYEVDRKIVDQEIARKMTRLPGSAVVFARPDTEEFENQLLAKLDGKMKPDEPIRLGVKSFKRSKAVVQNGASGEIFSWRTAVAYEKRPILDKGAYTTGGPFHSIAFPGAPKYYPPGRETALVFPGFSFDMQPLISHDRRKMQIKLTQRVTQIVAWKKDKLRTWLPNQELKEIDLEVPVLEERTFTSNFGSLDGEPIIAVVQGQRPGARAADKVLVLVLNPIIRIEEEERALREEQRRQKQK